ncbi:MAG: hypothetical protein Q8R92_21210, partial [Deltaproteobacteria bacterium]|nr:hypothetical protein [Deltaproteobacteria bacterium]
SWAKIAGRYVMPVALTVAGFLSVQAFNDIKASTAAVVNSVSSLNRHIERLDGRINLTDRVNQEQDGRLGDHSRRLGILERPTNFPVRP